MRVAVVHNRDTSGVINVFGMQNRERYNPKTVERVASALEKGGHTVRVLEGNMHLADQLVDFMPRVVSGERPGMVFNMAYGIQGVSRYTHIPAMLEMLGVPYVGSGPQAHGLALDKVVAKMVFDANGLPTARFWNFASADQQFDDLEFPVIVKPKMEAVSYGITIVDNWDDLREAVGAIIDEFGQHVLVEQFIEGREFGVGLLGNGDPEVLPIVEIDFGGDAAAIQTVDDKLQAPRGKICPPDLSEDQAQGIREVTKRAFSSLDLFDFARVDYRMDAAGELYILEINSMASLGSTGTYVHAAQTAGYDFDQLINRMLDVASVRYFGDAHEEESERARMPTARRRPLSVRVRSYMRSQAANVDEMLQQLVDLPSPATDPDQVNAAADWFSRKLELVGLRETVHPFVRLGNARFFSNHDGDEHDVLLLGHIDTPAALRFRRFQHEGRRVYGTGVLDGKGGLVVGLAALRALRHSRALRRLRVGFLVTTDATEDGRNGAALVRQYAERSGAVLGLQGGDEDGSFFGSRSGRATYRVSASFPTGTRELAPDRAVRTFVSRLLDTQRLANENVRIAVTRIDVDAPFEHLPETATATITVRFNESASWPDLEQAVRAALTRRTSGMRMTVHGGLRRPPLERTATREALIANAERLASSINVPTKAAHRWGSTNVGFVPDNIAAIDGLGPVGAERASTDEHIYRGSLTERAALLALLIDAHRGAGSSRPSQAVEASAEPSSDTHATE